MASRSIFVFLAAVLIGGCGDDRDDEIPAELSVNSLPGVYAGVFPCAGCPGIPTTVWVRADGRYFIEQRYPETDEREVMHAHNLGRWKWDSADHVLSLQGAGPIRTFERRDDATLIMRTASELEHKLTRDPVAPEFSAPIRMTGKVRVNADGAAFTECLTGYVAPVTKRGDYSRFLHQYRSAGGRGHPTYVELDGRFSWSDAGVLQALTIERFVTIKASGGC